MAIMLLNRDGSVVDLAGVAHGPVFAPMDIFLSYMVTVDRTAIKEPLDVIAFNTDSRANFPVQVNPLAGFSGDNNARYYIVHLPTDIFPDPRAKVTMKM